MNLVIRACLLIMAALAFLAAIGEKESKGKSVYAVLCMFFTV